MAPFKNKPTTLCHKKLKKEFNFIFLVRLTALHFSKLCFMMVVYVCLLFVLCFLVFILFVLIFYYYLFFLFSQQSAVVTKRNSRFFILLYTQVFCSCFQNSFSSSVQFLSIISVSSFFVKKYIKNKAIYHHRIIVLFVTRFRNHLFSSLTKQTFSLFKNPNSRSFFFFFFRYLFFFNSLTGILLYIFFVFSFFIINLSK